MKIYESVTQLIGKTPLIKLNGLIKHHNLKANLIAKVEAFNPAGSVKDRIAYAMISKALLDNKINKDTVIIEPTSGNTGIGLAQVCTALSLKLIIVMPDSMSIERRNRLRAFGAKVVYYSASGKNSSKDFERVSFDELLKESDIISIHAPLNENTNKLINYDALCQMKKSAILINMGRGPIVCEEDLAKALNEGKIKGAALAVFEIEPIKEDSPILKVKDKEIYGVQFHPESILTESGIDIFKNWIEKGVCIKND